MTEMVCPHCDKPVKNECLTFCDCCHNALSQSDKERGRKKFQELWQEENWRETEIKPGLGGMLCPHCGNKVKNELLTFCDSCQHTLSQKDKETGRKELRELRGDAIQKETAGERAHYKSLADKLIEEMWGKNPQWVGQTKKNLESLSPYSDEYANYRGLMSRWSKVSRAFNESRELTGYEYYTEIKEIYDGLRSKTGGKEYYQPTGSNKFLNYLIISLIVFIAHAIYYWSNNDLSSFSSSSGWIMIASLAWPVVLIVYFFMGIFMFT